MNANPLTKPNPKPRDERVISLRDLQYEIITLLITRKWATSAANPANPHQQTDRGPFPSSRFLITRSPWGVSKETPWAQIQLALPEASVA